MFLLQVIGRHNKKCLINAFKAVVLARSETSQPCQNGAGKGDAKANGGSRRIDSVRLLYIAAFDQEQNNEKNRDTGGEEVDPGVIHSLPIG